MMRTIIAMMSALLLSLSAKAEPEKINGAFGLSLGDVLDTTKALGVTPLSDGTTAYKFSPSKPFRSVKEYNVLVTPKTKRIFEIWAEGTLLTHEIALNEQALVLSLLERKYGKRTDEKPLFTFTDYEAIDQGNRMVLVIVTDDYKDSRIKIRYRDNELKELAEKERIELEADKVDASGL